LIPSLGFARDLGVLLQPIHQGKFTSSILYEHLKVHDDFNTRGRVDFNTNVAGAEFTYGITDQIAIGLKGGSTFDSRVDAQGSQWKSSYGSLYGIDLYDEIFPATPGWQPGIQVSGGVSGFQIPLDRTNVSSGTWQTIDQKMSGFEYHGAVLAVFKVGITSPYAGLRAFAGETNWKDNAPPVGSPDVITGHPHGNISVVVGLPIQIAKEIRLQLEGRFISETAVTAGFTLAAF